MTTNPLIDWMFDFSGWWGCISNLMDELYDILKGVQLNWDIGFRTITLKSNTEFGYWSIFQDDNTFHPHASVHGQIRTFLTHHRSLSIS
jgi:hypothetical protein